MRLPILKVPGKCLRFAAALLSGMATPATTVNRFEGILGLEQRKNDLFYSTPSSSDLQEEGKVMVFFGGDVQVNHNYK